MSLCFLKYARFRVSPFHRFPNELYQIKNFLSSKLVINKVQDRVILEGLLNKYITPLTSGGDITSPISCGIVRNDCKHIYKKIDNISKLILLTMLY